MLHFLSAVDAIILGFLEEVAATCNAKTRFFRFVQSLDKLVGYIDLAFRNHLHMIQVSNFNSKHFSAYFRLRDVALGIT